MNIDDIKNLLRNNKIKIKNYQEEKIEFYSPQDVKVASQILNKNGLSFKVHDNSVMLSMKPKKMREETTTIDVGSNIAIKNTKDNPYLKKIQRRVANKLTESENYKDIVRAFDKITNVKVKNKSIVVYGFIGGQPRENVYSYTNAVVARAMKKKLDNFKGIE